MGWFSGDKKPITLEGQKQDALKQILADGEAAKKVIGDYGGVLGVVNNMGFGAPESLLPRSKEEIKHAIRKYLLYSHLTQTLDEKFFSILEVGYAQLSEFLNDLDARNAAAYQAVLNYAIDSERTAEDITEIANRMSSDSVKAALARYAQSQKEFEALMYEFNAFAKKIGIPFAKTPDQIGQSITEAQEIAKHTMPK